MRSNILVGVGAIVLLTVVGWLAWNFVPRSAPSPATLASTTPQVSARIVPAGYKEYSSATYHFSLLYPDGLSVQTYKEKNSAMTAVFSSADNTQGFQIFVVPYGEQEITQARMDLDIPSGVADDLTNILVDGKPAIMFYSADAVLGDTREVWFINHGFLFEVTTYKSLDSWLSHIMQSWEFF